MRPKTVLFMLMSVDGKISTGDIDKFDFDKDLPKIPEVSKGLYQYYEAEMKTSKWSFNTGRVLSKVGWNKKIVNDNLKQVSFLIYDNRWLTYEGIENLSKACNRVVIATNSSIHPVFVTDFDNVDVFRIQQNSISPCFEYIRDKYGCEAITIQSGGSMNGQLFREGLIDYVNLYVAPLIVGGRLVSTLVDGDSISSIKELTPMKLLNVEILHNGYLNLRYAILR